MFKNLDEIKAQKTQILKDLSAAVKNDDAEAFANALESMAQNIEQVVMAEFQGVVGVADSQILSGRGVRQLTSQENAYYQKLITAMKSADPRQAVTFIDDVLPTSVIDTIFADIQAEHPLLSLIDFQNTGLLTKWLASTTSGVAAWGELTATIAAELTASFSMIDLDQKKLSAFVPVAKAMLDIGPAWLDRYVRAILGEALAVQLEAGIADGDGDDKPLGMTRALSGATDGVYPRKSAIAITSFTPTVFGTLLNTISQGPNSKRRVVPELLLVVNPADYFTKVFPATTLRLPDGTFRNDVFPYPTKVVQSDAIPAGYAVIGLAKRYFMGLGTGKGGKLEYSDEYKFLEDIRTYLIKLYGNGKPMDANAFIYLDITGLVAADYEIKVTNFPSSTEVSNLEDIVIPAYPDARLASLTIGSLSLSPAFNKSVMNYTAATTNATNTITAIAKDGEATIEILNGATPVANGSAATWAEGENTLTINVSIDGETETYTVIVTKS
jgi:hypothetical protein